MLHAIQGISRPAKTAGAAKKDLAVGDCGAAAAILLIVLAIQFWPKLIKQEGVQVIANNLPPIVGVLDFRGTLSQRASQEPHRVLAPSIDELQIILPDGSQTGDYILEIIQADRVSNPVAKYSGKVFPQANGVLALKAKVDISMLKKGPYVLRWRPNTGLQPWEQGDFLIE